MNPSIDISALKRVYVKPRIVAFIPAHNEENSIRDCLEGLADQDLPPNVELDVFVIADNCTDKTEDEALKAGHDLDLRVIVIKTKGNKQRKVGALNSAWKSIYGDVMELYENKLTPFQEKYKPAVKAILGMDADSRLAPHSLLHMWSGLMSARNIGGVMAKYTMRMPQKKSALTRDDPYYEQKLRSGKYGGPIQRWWTHQQKQDMASWILNLQYHGGSTYVLGGQATLFRPEALENIVNENNLDGPWQNDSDVEDMLLTWQLQKLKWKTLISPDARCFVDAMRSYHTYRQQRNKWRGGTVDLLTNKDIKIKTRHYGMLWRSQMKTFIDLFIRILFFVLLTVAISTDQFVWSWLWIIPVALASILNFVLALKTPMSRPIDIFLGGLVISTEIYLWVNFLTFIQVWLDKLSPYKKDGWAQQYQAENGTTRSKLWQGLGLFALFMTALVLSAIHYREYLTSESFQELTAPYLEFGWLILTYLTIFASSVMVYKIWTLRSRHKA
ncbi:glycosyltransferase family 2 protein [Alkalicoccobacillus plakortidis]|uniref:Glycosyltransferase family 2 protein n=1 Tax=Alkalicoccobacillus plakortidis TaxID=444060 RepID=A0ABT0XQ67_9BACI|nr:glycosyltransferase family 2 protein [Alkalicoccobacillus plakortidis]MCM2678050.1 glycosyltransferase family 2 protein [Alkalicoccobacillus plakortidis]